MVVSVLLLVLIGIISITSISLARNDFLNLYKQIIFAMIGFFLMIVFGFLDWRGLKDNSYLVLVLYVICSLLLAGLLFFATEIRGVKSWYRIGLFSFDPIGITTIVLIIILAKFFSKRHVEMYKLRHIILSGFYVFIPFVLIAIQPDLGSALILLAIWIGVLIVSAIKLKHFAILMLVGIVVFAASWFLFLKDYQKNRIISFLQPEQGVLGMNWSQTQSKIAIGSGGIFGQGFAKGSQTQHGFLSEPYTDFIFSAWAEEFGLFGVLILFFLFSILFWRIMRIAFLATSNFPRLFAAGFAIFIFSQMVIHVGMNLGILPVIGLPLPFVSYGGSNLLALFAGLGILQSIKVNK
jgi:rod shape determining protein RodA